MLVVTRRIGERIMIGSNVSITVLGVQDAQVRIGIDAPRDVAVHARIDGCALTENRPLSSWIEQTRKQAYPVTGKEITSPFGERIEERDFLPVPGVEG